MACQGSVYLVAGFPLHMHMFGSQCCCPSDFCKEQLPPGHNSLCVQMFTLLFMIPRMVYSQLPLWLSFHQILEYRHISSCSAKGIDPITFLTLLKGCILVISLIEPLLSCYFMAWRNVNQTFALKFVHQNGVSLNNARTRNHAITYARLLGIDDLLINENPAAAVVSYGIISFVSHSTLTLLFI
jgi:hypothetical protein